MTEEAKPDIAFEGLSIWVLGRTFPDVTDYWDGNMLTIRLRMKTAGSCVDVIERGVHLSDISRFVSDLTTMNNTLRGTAKLNPLEPSFKLELGGDDKGHINATIDLTPDHVTENHEFIIFMDQTYLGSILSGFRSVLGRYPLRSDG
jgi:hypothetical protein